jgi:threonine dehydrogenase-like Zn-dependent dehydrogenase
MVEEDMKAVVFHGIGDIRLEDVPDPELAEPTDAIVRLTASAICGTDLHFVRGTVPGMRPGTILGHEGVGIVEEVGADVRNLRPGDRVVIPSTIACGACSYCRAGYQSQCDRANPNGPLAGTSFYGGPAQTGPVNGLQAEKARIPLAHVNLVRLPDEIDDDAAIMLSDIAPTGWYGAELAEVGDGDVVAVFGCGPVGQFAISSAKLMGADRVIAVDRVPDRLDMARAQGAETVDFETEDPVETIRRLTGGIGTDRAIDAVGVDAMHAHAGPAALASERERDEAAREVAGIAPDAAPKGDLFVPGDRPSQAARWAVQALAKAGTLGIIGVYPETAEIFPIGTAMNKNLTIKMGNCPHRRIIPHLIGLVQAGVLKPAEVLTKRAGIVSALDAYAHFDRREAGWMKVELKPDRA